MTPTAVFFVVLCGVALALLIAMVLYLALAVWPEVRPLLRLRCLALRCELEGQSVDLEASTTQASHRVRRKRKVNTAPLEARDADVSARSVEDWRYEHGLAMFDPLPEGYEVRGGVVVAVKSTNPLVRDPDPVPLLRIR
jgi:hypothetical protein